MRWNLRTSSLIAALAACAVALLAQTPSSEAVADLTGPVWQLVQFLSKDGNLRLPDERARYTLVFQKDGRVNARLDCNRGNGSWKSTGHNKIEFRPMAMTRAMCPPQSMSDQLGHDLSLVRSYSLKNGHLFLDLGDGGIYEFEPQPAPPAPRPQPKAGNVAKTDFGLVEGAVSDDVLSFKGIPFAAPPIGNLRWRAPQPPQPWGGVRSAVTFGNDCMQLPVSGDDAPLTTTPSEDCLVLIVWRPANVASGERLPVLFWIHGGGYVNGGTSSPVYDGSAFARQGIVFVSANYRLGRFGFFLHPALAAAKEGIVGNFAYMDQMAALRWVQRNIAAFNGDLARVTVMGESAGGDSIMHLIVAPAAKGLFQRAVVMSGDGRTHLLGGDKPSGGTEAAPSADLIGLNFARSAGITGVGPDALRALRALPAQQVMGDLNMASLSRPAPGPLTYCGGPIVDGVNVDSAPGEMMRLGEAVRIPILIGTTGADIATKFPPSRTYPFTYFGIDASRASVAYNPTNKLPLSELYQTIGVDMTMHEPARFVAGQMTAVGTPAWLYRFDYVAESLRPKVQAAPHASEIPYFFDTLAARYGAAVTQNDRAAARAANQYLVNFVKNGNPNAEGLPHWKKYEPAIDGIMIFESVRGPVMQPDPWRERLNLVERAADEQLAATATSK
jgi:para-nitrobenzyl esterase